jgi:hypothetical protein
MSWALNSNPAWKSVKAKPMFNLLRSPLVKDHHANSSRPWAELNSMVKFAVLNPNVKGVKGVSHPKSFCFLGL